MVNDLYFPERGDLVWIDFSPQAGYEHRGRRPALVVSPSSYNSKVGLALLCPVTSKIKNYPFEVLLPSNYLISGVVLSDQVKSLDWRSRNAEFIEKVSSTVINKVLSRINILLM